MANFEHMEQKGQMTIFELLDEIELIKFRKSSAKVNNVVDNVKRPRKIGFIIRA